MPARSVQIAAFAEHAVAGMVDAGRPRDRDRAYGGEPDPLARARRELLAGRPAYAYVLMVLVQAVDRGEMRRLHPATRHGASPRCSIVFEHLHAWLRDMPQGRDLVRWFPNVRTYPGFEDLPA